MRRKWSIPCLSRSRSHSGSALSAVMFMTETNPLKNCRKLGSARAAGSQIRICAAMMARPGGGILPPGRFFHGRCAPFLIFWWERLLFSGRRGKITVALKRHMIEYPPWRSWISQQIPILKAGGSNPSGRGHNQNPVDLCRRDFGFFGSLDDTIRRPNTASRTISPLPAFLFLEKLPAGIRNVFKASQKTCCSLPVSPNGFLKLITSGELWARMNNAEKFERN